MQELEFGQPAYLWLLIAPAALALLWVRLFLRRRRDIRRMREGRALPVIERHAAGRGLWFWLALVGASACVVVALARPQALVAVTESAGVDFVVLLDGSTSMRVTDVAPDRWQRSVAWLRTFAEVLGWRQERVALALFAHRAAPQVRLTSDPNALFFFLDHLSDEPPFRLRDDTSWDTNIEDGIAWGVKMIDKDEELYGARLGARAFVVLSPTGSRGPGKWNAPSAWRRSGTSGSMSSAWGLTREDSSRNCRSGATSSRSRRSTRCSTASRSVR